MIFGRTLNILKMYLWLSTECVDLIIRDRFVNLALGHGTFYLQGTIVAQPKNLHSTHDKNALTVPHISLS